MKTAARAGLALLLLVSGLHTAQAERLDNKPACTIVRIDAAAFLERCAAQLRSFVLSMPGTERTAAREHTNKFRFSCRPGFCQDEPHITGWFIDPDMWRRSKQDEAAIFDIFAELAGWKLLKSEAHFRTLFKPVCALSGVMLAGVPGKMICYELKSGDSALATVLMIAAEPEIGLVLSFDGPDLKSVQEYARSSLQRFNLARSRGDAALERWLQ
jgi:hypothetical protein